MNSLFQELNGPQSTMGQFTKFMQNPMLFLMRRRNIQIPEQYRNDPEKTVNYLISSGNMDQKSFNFYRSQASNMGYKF